MSTLPLTLQQIDDPANYRLGLMISDDAIDVVVRRVMGEGEALTAHIALAQVADRAAAVEEAIYANPLLPAQPFNRVDIILRPDRFQIVDEATGRDPAAIDTLLELVAGTEELPAVLADKVTDAYRMLIALPPMLEKFLHRTFDRAHIRGHLSVLAEYFHRQSRQGNCNKIYAVIHGSRLDVLAFAPAGLQAANSYVCPSINDAAYYILVLAKMLNFSVETDHLLVAGDSSLRASLLSHLRQFAANAMPAILPAEAGAVNAPVHLQILPLCE